jgi:hypothetical protein
VSSLSSLAVFVGWSGSRLVRLVGYLCQYLDLRSSWYLGIVSPHPIVFAEHGRLNKQLVTLDAICVHALSVSSH